MKFLLTSSGISNTSIHDALVELLGKPIAESSALYIPTGVQPFPGGPSHVYQFISGATRSPMCGLGWKSLGVLELTALPSIKEEYWVPAVRDADALLVWQPLVSVLLDAAIRAGRPPALAAARNGLRRHERRSDGGDSRLRWNDVRRERAAYRQRQRAGAGRFLGFPTPRSRGWHSAHLARGDRSMGRGAIGACLRDRRSDRDQGGRRH